VSEKAKMKRIIMRILLSVVLTAITMKGVYGMNSDVLLFSRLHSCLVIFIQEMYMAIMAVGG